MDYLFRPSSTDEFYEEQLMACIWSGAMSYPENNLAEMIKWFIERGYWGYLKYDIDAVTGKVKDTPGFYTGGISAGGVKQKLFQSIRDYIDHRCHVERHYRILEQWRKIRSMEEMHSYDLVTASGGCLMGHQSIHHKLLAKKQSNKFAQLDTKTAFW